MDWFLYDNGLRHEKVNIWVNLGKLTRFHSCIRQVKIIDDPKYINQYASCLNVDED